MKLVAKTNQRLERHGGHRLGLRSLIPLHETAYNHAWAADGYFRDILPVQKSRKQSPGLSLKKMMIRRE